MYTIALKKWLATDSPYNGLAPSNTPAMNGALQESGKHFPPTNAKLCSSNIHIPKDRGNTKSDILQCFQFMYINCIYDFNIDSN
jgi:hypothetical protein